MEQDDTQTESSIGSSTKSDETPESTATMDELTETGHTEKSAYAVSRRSLLKGAASAAVGGTGMMAVSGTAAAGDLGCDYNFARAPSWFGYVNPTTGATHNLPWGSDNLTIFIHGFKTQQQGALDYGYEVWRKLRDMGYRGDGFSCIWDAGDSNIDWPWAQANAPDAGYDLGNWLASIGCVGNNGIQVNLVCHSLGARMALSCLATLQNKGLFVNTVHFLGGAVWDRLVGKFYLDAVALGCRSLHNWHSLNDDVLGNVFQAAEAGHHAVGWSGIAGEVPVNWTDHDHSFEIHQHCEYMHYDAGVVNDLYYHL